MKLFGLLLYVVLSVSYAQTEVVLTPIRDASLYQEGDLSNGGGSYLFSGVTANGQWRNAMLRFDFSSIPPNAIIEEAQLILTVSRVPPIPSAVSLRLHRVSSSWGEGSTQAPGQEGTGADAQLGDATWLHRQFDAVFWNSPGGDYQAVHSAESIVIGLGPYTWSSDEMLSDISFWNQFPSSNQGWALVAISSAAFGTAKRFNSREHSDPIVRPRLRVTYSGGTPIVEPVAVPVFGFYGIFLLIGLVFVCVSLNRSKFN